MKFILSILIIGFLSLSACDSNNRKATPSIDQNGQSQEFLDKGIEIASATFSALSGQLQKSMKEGGVPNAIAYCNVEAYPITDSLSAHHNAQIKRTSSRIRNPRNNPSHLELEAIKKYDTQLKNSKAPEPYIISDKDAVHFFAPIIINDLCLKCHGSINDDIPEGDYAEILKYYPEDQAVGYNAGDLRGIWSIQFNP